MRDWKPIELLSHARHDWMNRIQLIKGYLSMGNIEKVNEIIDQIIQMSTQESKLSNIQLPEFATLLLTYNWISPAFILNYEIEGNGKITNIDDLFITNWFKAFFQLVDQAVSPEEDNELIVKIALNHKESHRFFIEFYGIINNTDMIQTFLQKSELPITNINLSKEAMSFELLV